MKDTILCIEDTGIGIASEDLSRIFLRKDIQDIMVGFIKRLVGLDFYLCKRICNNLEIDIYVTSELYRGTTVHINLEQNNLKND